MMKSRLPLLFFVVSAHLCLVADGILVLRFPDTGLASAKYVDKLPRETYLHNLTICFRVNMFSFRATNPILGLQDTAMMHLVQLRLELWVDKIRPVLSDTWRLLYLPENLKINRWYHFCVSYNGEESLYRLYFEGEMVGELESEVHRVAQGDEFFVGLSMKGGPSFHGELTQLNVWDNILPEESIVKIATCQEDIEGNYVQWGKGFDLNFVESDGKPLHVFCENTYGTTYMWFPRLTYTQAFYICEALGGHLPLPNVRHEYGGLQHMSIEKWRSEGTCTANFITFLNDNQEEGRFVRDYDGKYYTNDEILWNEDEPNGQRFENCVFMSDGGVYDDNCGGLHCALCEFQKPQVYVLHGACEKEERNVYYSAYQREGLGSLEFIGYGNYEIRLTKNGSESGQYQWLFSDGSVIATMETSQLNYPMGRHLWSIAESQMVCGHRGGSRTLLLTRCKTGEFTCDDGDCIPLELHCDFKYDCKDGSDEGDCNLVSFPKDYRNIIPPLGVGGTPLKIAVNLTLESLGVDTSKTQLKATFQLGLTWEDSRLSYRNMKEIDNLNVVPHDVTSSSTAYRMWTPVVAFVNTETNERSVVDKYASMRVEKRTDMEKWNESAGSEETLFPGRGNFITFTRKYASAFVCSFELSYYPFDVQRCPLTFRLFESSSQYLIFDGKNVTVEYIGNKMLIEYQVGETSLDLTEARVMSDNFSELTVKVMLTRRSGYAILTIYLPSLILLIISYVTLFFRPVIFETRVMAALTSLLVVATLFTQAASSLPKTSYFKTVDIWLLFCIGVIFLIIICHALIDDALHSKTRNSDVGRDLESSLVSTNDGFIGDTTDDKMSDQETSFYGNVIWPTEKDSRPPSSVTLTIPGLDTPVYHPPNRKLFKSTATVGDQMEGVTKRRAWKEQKPRNKILDRIKSHFTVDKLMKYSKITVLLIIILFNICYCGYIICS